VIEVAIVFGLLFAITIGAAIEYYKQLQKTKKEYEKARAVIDDIVLSFGRELKQETEKLETVIYKVEANSSRSERALKENSETTRKVAELEQKVNKIHNDEERLMNRLDEIDKKTNTAIESYGVLTSKISAIEEQIRQGPIIPETKMEAVIPIKREKALAPLTETELSVLEMLSSEGPKTAPEIKDRIKLSREHTARLMKKLYEGGYLDREAGKIPFKYSVKKEMEKFLKKNVSEAAS